MSKPIISSVLAVFALCSCELVNLERISFTTFPGESDALLGATTPVWIDFSLPVEKTGAEMLFTVRSPGGNVSGDYAWQGNRLEFHPRTAYEPGIRYVVSFSGEVKTDDGRRFPVMAAVPFFSISSGLPARLAASNPADGALAGGTAPLTFTFTKSMDASISIDDFLSVSPSVEFSQEWRNANTELVIRPRTQWKPLELLTWRISPRLRDNEGIALQREYSGGFLVQNPAAPAPVIASLQPAIDSWEQRFPPAGAELGPNERQESWINRRDAIRINFRVPDHAAADDPSRIDFASLKKAFSISPSLRGTLQSLATEDGRDDGCVFLLEPEERFLMDTIYHVKISRDLVNLEGAAMQSEFEAWFSADLPSVSVERIIISNVNFHDVNLAVSKADFNSYIEHDASILAGYAPDYYTIEFNNGFLLTAADAYALADKIELTRIFPESGGPYDKRNAVALPGSPPLLTIAYAGAPSAGGTVFRLLIKGGPDGLVDARGSYLPHDVFIYFKLNED